MGIGTSKTAGTATAVSSPTGATSALTFPIDSISLLPAERPSSHPYRDHEQEHTHVPHTLEVGPPCLQCGRHALEHDHARQGAGKPCDKAVYVWLQRWQVQKPRTGRVLWYYEDIIFAFGKVGPS